MEYRALSISEVSELVRAQEVSPVELTESCLARIEELNPKINAFITVTAEQAIQQAREAETEIRKGMWRGPLHGIPISLKDLIDTAGVRTTAGSQLFKDRVPDENAVVASRLREAGAVLVGKTNLHEFAYGGSSLVSYFGAVRNPWDLERIAGGSSSGAAAAVSTGMCYAGIGTDSAGSVRMPAALCGVVGLKPTYGRVSTRGVLPLAWSYDHVGPITRTARDAALVLQAISGYDDQDPGSVPMADGDFTATLERDTSALRLGVARQFFFEGLDPQIDQAMERSLSVLNKLTGVCVEVRVPADTDYTVHTCEAYVYHSKFLEDSSSLYQPDTLRRVRSGEKTNVADYIQKRRELERFRHAAATIYREVDVIVTPSTPILPPRIAELEKDPKELRRKETLLLRNARPFNILGVPAISLPCGFSDEGLPIGLQLSGRPGEEALLLAVAHQFERAVNCSRIAKP
jgi:aspartyl-tRNA(Asn)/glutamyl-tRNA(Gln) amidotransferase subunit A